ncbi:MAG: PaeR7I family type II restriction endonuclease [Muribaculaceae bacterium]|nr:PaeR7I family type II restriction endonuclease [Muribaculaceae bacterium]
MNKAFDIISSTAKAIDTFWRTKNKQLQSSSDSSNRGAVVGGKQLDGFLELLKEACLSAGVPEECINVNNNYVPGFFRSSKDWDFIIISPSGKLLVLIELKSQVGSYGNNFNNRTEEALGNATDLWTAYREQEFPTYGTPWVGYLMLIGDDEKSTAPVKNYTKHFPVLREFENASYIDRYRILCEKLMTERLYTSACLIRTKNAKTFCDATEGLSIVRFINSLKGYLLGCASEFDR